jgi:Spy/CpxP family protein refolding chaperone
VHCYAPVFYYQQPNDSLRCYMKIKPMPMLGAVMALATVATPFTAKSQSIPSAKILIASAPQPQFQWRQLNLSHVQKRQLRQIRRKTRRPLQAIYTAQQREKLKTLLKASRQGQNHPLWQMGHQQGS